MGLKALFDKKKQEWNHRKAVKSAYKSLIAAIDDRKIAEITDILRTLSPEGRDLIAGEFGVHPTKHAFRAGNPQVFKVLLESLGGSDQWMISRVSDNNYEYRTLLYSAIEAGQTDLALVLIRHEGTNVESSGYGRGGTFPLPIDKARQMGLIQVNIELAERLAAQYRMAADELTNEANTLRGRKTLPALPPAPLPRPTRD